MPMRHGGRVAMSSSNLAREGGGEYLYSYFRWPVEVIKLNRPGAVHGACTRCLRMQAVIASISSVNTRQRKTLRAIFTKPASATIVFSDIEALIIGLGGEVHEREGSRVKILLMGEQWRCHRPHPGKEAKRYQVEEARELLERVGVKP